MRSSIVLVMLSLVLLGDMLFASNSAGGVDVSLKITGTHLLCRAKNLGTNDVVTDEPFHQDNSFVARYPGRNVFIGCTEHSVNRLKIAGGEEKVWSIALADLIGFAGAGTMMPGQVMRLEWACVGRISNPVWLAVPDENGKFALRDMAAADGSTKPILAFVFNGKQRPELGFLLVNGTRTDVLGANPLTSRSRVVASVQKIKYARELTTPEADVHEVTVKANKSVEWRLPWQKVLDLIPKEDLAKIEAAGGDLDLVWKVGDLESTPLAMILVKEIEGGVRAQKDRTADRSSIPDVFPQATNALPR